MRMRFNQQQLTTAGIPWVFVTESEGIIGSGVGGVVGGIRIGGCPEEFSGGKLGFAPSEALVLSGSVFGVGMSK